MNQKELNEIRRRFRLDKNNFSRIFGCYVNSNREVISWIDASLGLMRQEETIHIGIVTGSVSQSEDDRRGAAAFQQLYGEGNVTLVTYPDNFTEELETTIQCMSSKITSTISVQLMPLYKSPHITKGLSSAAVLTGRGGNVTISTSKSLGEKNR
jgi:hypothetical protein